MTSAKAAFPAVGHSYEVDFDGGNAFRIEFKSDSEMLFIKLAPPNEGATEAVRFTYRPIRDDVFLVYWQEADKTTVVHVEDFGQGVIYSNITSPDGSFFNDSSKLTRVK